MQPLDDAASPRKGAADIPGIVCPVPVLAFSALAFGVVLDQIIPIGVVGSFGRALRLAIAAILILLGGWFLSVGMAAFRRLGTHYAPWKPSRALAMTGIYDRTRNPMYQGFLVLVLGLA